MRVAILSDIHGNLIALNSVLQDLSQQPPVDAIVIAGDLCLNGPCPRQVLDTIQGLQCPVIQGNVDVDVVTIAPKSTKKRNIIEWTRQQIGQAGIDYLASLPRQHLVANPEGSDLLVVHANPLDQQQAIFPDAPDSMLEHLLGQLPPTIGAIAFGHLHITYTRHWRHRLLVDVGSCGLPRDQNQHASYAILAWQDNTWQAEHRRVAYDLETVVQQLRTCGMPHAEKRIKVLTEASYT